MKKRSDIQRKKVSRIANSQIAGRFGPGRLERTSILNVYLPSVGPVNRSERRMLVSQRIWIVFVRSTLGDR